MLTTADQYYVKAKGGYPFNLEEVLENLSYALSYDQEHPGAHLLMGRFLMDQMHDYEQAEVHFVQAISSNPGYWQVYEHFAFLLVRKREFGRAAKLIEQGSVLPGACQATFLHLQATICEYEREYGKALYLVREALLETFNADFTEYLEEEERRIQNKGERVKRVRYTT